jgi:hypothetical protein
MSFYNPNQAGIPGNNGSGFGNLFGGFRYGTYGDRHRGNSRSGLTFGSGRQMKQYFENQAELERVKAQNSMDMKTHEANVGDWSEQQTHGRNKEDREHANTEMQKIMDANSHLAHYDANNNVYKFGKRETPAAGPAAGPAADGLVGSSEEGHGGDGHASYEDASNAVLGGHIAPIQAMNLSPEYGQQWALSKVDADGRTAKMGPQFKVADNFVHPDDE